MLYGEIDGRFPNHHPDPTVPKNLDALVAEVQRRGADVGIAFDGDADRIGVVDDTGAILFGDQLDGGAGARRAAQRIPAPPSSPT